MGLCELAHGTFRGLQTLMSLFFPGTVLGCVLVALAVTCVFAMMGPLAVVSSDDGQPPAPYPAMAAWGFAMLSVFRSPRSGLQMLLLFNLFTGLIAIGSVVLLAMAVSVDDLRWSRFYKEDSGGDHAGKCSGCAHHACPGADPVAWGSLTVPERNFGGPYGFSGPFMGLLLLIIFCLGNWAVWISFRDRGRNCRTVPALRGDQDSLCHPFCRADDPDPVAEIRGTSCRFLVGDCHVLWWGAEHSPVDDEPAHHCQ